MKMIPGKWYYVSDKSVDDAVKEKIRRRFSNFSKVGTMIFETLIDPELTNSWKYAVPVEEDQEMDEIKEGDEVYVSEDSIEHALKNKEKRIYLMTLNKGGHLCVNGSETERYKNGSIFNVVQWQYVKKVPKQTELTMAQIAEKFGVPVEQLRIKE